MMRGGYQIQAGHASLRALVGVVVSGNDLLPVAGEELRHRTSGFVDASRARTWALLCTATAVVFQTRPGTDRRSEAKGHLTPPTSESAILLLQRAKAFWTPNKNEVGTGLAFCSQSSAGANTPGNGASDLQDRLPTCFKHWSLLPTCFKHWSPRSRQAASCSLVHASSSPQHASGRVPRGIPRAGYVKPRVCRGMPRFFPRHAPGFVVASGRSSRCSVASRPDSVVGPCDRLYDSLIVRRSQIN